MLKTAPVESESGKENLWEMTQKNWLVKSRKLWRESIIDERKLAFIAGNKKSEMQKDEFYNVIILSGVWQDDKVFSFLHHWAL